MDQFKIKFARSKSVLSVAAGQNLMKSLLAAQVPVASSCNGEGICGKCRITILEGNESLEAPNDLEALLKEKFQLNRNQRISCQVIVKGDLKIDAPYW